MSHKHHVTNTVTQKHNRVTNTVSHKHTVSHKNRVTQKHNRVTNAVSHKHRIAQTPCDTVPHKHCVTQTLCHTKSQSCDKRRVALVPVLFQFFWKGTFEHSVLHLFHLGMTHFTHHRLTRLNALILERLV